jgi:hypothetical protein
MKAADFFFQSSGKPFASSFSPWATGLDSAMDESYSVLEMALKSIHSRLSRGKVLGGIYFKCSGLDC